jgi:hypothetical protein
LHKNPHVIATLVVEIAACQGGVSFGNFSFTRLIFLALFPFDLPVE